MLSLILESREAHRSLRTLTGAIEANPLAARFAKITAARLAPLSDAAAAVTIEQMSTELHEMIARETPLALQAAVDGLLIGFREIVWRVRAELRSREAGHA